MLKISSDFRMMCSFVLPNKKCFQMVASRKRKRPKPSFEWSRRSTRFRAEFNIDDSGAWRDESSPLETVVVLEVQAF